MRVFNKAIAASVVAGMCSFFTLTATQAAEGNLSVGKDFTDITVGTAQVSPGLYINGGWIKNNKNGSEVAGAETGLNITAGDALVNLGVQADYVRGHSGQGEGMVFPIGAGVKIPVSEDVGFYTSIYTAPRQLSNTASSYLDFDTGLSWHPANAVTLKAGYRYIGMDGKNGRGNQRLIDGPYLGAGVAF